VYAWASFRVNVSAGRGMWAIPCRTISTKEKAACEPLGLTDEIPSQFELLCRGSVRVAELWYSGSTNLSELCGGWAGSDCIERWI
jgi:hypothetical protein